MTIPSNHEIGDEVWFENSRSEIKKSKVIGFKYIYPTLGVLWKLEDTELEAGKEMEENITIPDSCCFKTKEELIKSIIEFQKWLGQDEP